MGHRGKWEYLKAIYERYRRSNKADKHRILDEFCKVTSYHRKSALRLLNGPPPGPKPHRRRAKTSTYLSKTIEILAAIWTAANHPWSLRLKALLPLWLPWARQRFDVTPFIEKQLLSLSPRHMDRLLAPRKRSLKKRLYGRTKPGSLLKHHIPLRVDRWNVSTPGFTEIDLVAHSGECADGDFINSLNVTDIHSTWVETRAVLGKSQVRVQLALDDIRDALPFPLLGIDSDNGSEFINDHLVRYCKTFQIQFTRGRPYKKDDNAHIEQKNWTHVRKLLGYVRYDSTDALAAINDLYRNELRLLQNLFLPAVKLITKTRVGSKVRRVYGPPQTPLDRVLASADADPKKVAALKALRERIDPFELSTAVDRKLEHIYALAHQRLSPQALHAANSVASR
jgi:hypothetical protein